MTLPVSNKTEIKELIDWLRKRAMPHSGIHYKSDHFDTGAYVELHGRDATFVVDHFHGSGATRMADALEKIAAMVSPQPVQDMHELPEVYGARWLLIKRGLYWRPNSQGYTGIKAEAGRYTDAEVKPYQDELEYEVTAILASDAPDFSPRCTDEAARRHLQTIVSSLTQKLDKAREALKPFADAVFNDNGDLTVDLSAANYDTIVSAYFAYRAALSEPGESR